MKPIVIVGAGLAGYGVAREIRKLDTTTPITLISQDKADFYSKPMLSNAFAQGKSAQQLVNSPAGKMAEQQQLTLLAETSVLSIDIAAHTLQTSHGEVAYQKLVLALGASPIRLPMAGDAAADVLSVNSLADYAVFRQRIEGSQRVVILGGGLIGCEFANDLSTGGYQVTVIDPGLWPLSALLPEGAGRALQQALSQKGVQFRFGQKVVSANRTASQVQLTLDNGEQVDADHVLSAVGLRPNTQLAAEAGLAVNRGIVADSNHLAAEDVYVIGDCAEVEGQWRPYVMPITIAAKSLAKTLIGEAEAAVFPVMPVQVKTPAYPILVQPAPRGVEGTWHEEVLAEGSIWQFVDTTGKVAGFVLTGKTIAAHRQRMVAAMS